MSSPRRRFWVILGLAGSGCLLTLLLVGMMGLVLLRRGTPAENVPSQVVSGWPEAASRASVSIVVYQPEYLPPDSREPRVSVFKLSENIFEVNAAYPSGLQISQTGNQRVIPPGAQVPTVVKGTLEASFSTERSGRGRALIINKTGTWIELSGQPDDQLVRIAESLREVQPGDANGQD